MVKTCAVAVCSSKSRKVSFHSFPKDVMLREMWIAACHRKNGININWDNASICSEHFTADDFVEGLQRWRLKQDAVPTLKLRGVQLKGLRKKMLGDDEDSTTCSEIVELNPVHLIFEKDEIKVESAVSNTTCPNVANVTPKPYAALETDPEAEQDYRKMYQHVMLDIQQLDKKITLLEYKLTVAQKQFKMATKNNAYNLLTKHFTANEIAKIQNKRTPVKWTKEEIVEAMTLFRLGKKAYLYLRNIKGFPLPGLPTLKQASARLC